ncbi:MAG TPA: hypothetical protein ENJ87_05545 [Gammaproteobacteria bacterium]|nr:hypothetical protein [Gammaproteobacteria bacterium]
MSIEIARRKSQKSPSYDDLLQPVVYGVLPDTSDDEISLVDIFSRLASQWRFISIAIVAGTLLAVILALVLPTVYQPALKVSIPTAGSVSVLGTVNAVLGGKNGIQSSPQAVFTRYYDLLRSGDVFAEYILDSHYLERLFSGITEQKSQLLAGLASGFRVNIEEPVPAHKGGYVADPKRLAVSIEVRDEAVGTELLNNYVKYVNQRLASNLQADTRAIIRSRIEILTRQVTRLREQYSQDRKLTIKKMEQEGAKKIALLQEQLSAYLAKEKANRVTRIAKAREALAMAESLDITYPTTLGAIAQKGQSNKGGNTAITVVDKQTSSLYLQGTKYLSTLITTLENRSNDEEYLEEVNSLREKIHVLKNDQTLAALKKRRSDDPWIKSLPETLAEIGALEALHPDFTGMASFSLGGSAVITGEKVKPRRKLIVVAGFVSSLFVALFVAMIMASLKEKKLNTEDNRETSD